MFKLVVPWNKTPSFGIARHKRQDEVLFHTTLNRFIQSCSTMKLTPSFGIARHIRQDEVLTPHYYEFDNGGREIQPLYLSPTRYFKLKVFMIKNHINARNLENIILISLGINFITLALIYIYI